MPNQTVTTDTGPVDVRYTDQGEGAPVLLLHGGGGPLTVAGFAERYAAEQPARVLTPVHPGFEGTERPAGLTTIAGLARLYDQLLDSLGLTDVTVVGNSIGGWIAAEMAVLDGSRTDAQRTGSPRIGRVVLVDAVGLQLDEHPIVDFFSLTMDEVADLSYADPDGFRIDVAALPPERQAAMVGNREALAVYGGTDRYASPMADPTLLGRLPGATVPALVVWGAADRIVVPAHGRAYASALPQARFVLIDDAGHLPQLETPETLVGLVAEFAGAGATT